MQFRNVSFDIADNQDVGEPRQPCRKTKFAYFLYILSIVILFCILLDIYMDYGGQLPTPTHKHYEKNPTTVHLDDVLYGKFMAHRFNGTWCNGSSIIYKKGDVISEYNVLTKKVTSLLPDEWDEFDSYEKSADGAFLLVWKEYDKLFQHTFVANYRIYDIKNQIFVAVHIEEKLRPLKLVKWAPVDNALVIHYNSNLYYKRSVYADEIRLTHNTDPAIVNGIPHWIYGEEFLGSKSAVWFSPDGKKLAFIQFNDTNASPSNISNCGQPYTKAGSPNPTTKLLISYLENEPIEQTDETDYMIATVNWLTNTSLLYIWMNRIQDEVHVQIDSGLKAKRLYSVKSETGWIDLLSEPLINYNGSRIAFIMARLQDTGDEYHHLVIVSTASDGYELEVLTRGKYEVTAILYWDNKYDILFYTANTAENYNHMHVYAIKAAAGQTAKCLTCNLHYWQAIPQTYYAAIFSKTGNVVITSLGPNVPKSAIYKWRYTNNQVELTELMIWGDNKALEKKLNDTEMPTIEIQSLPIADGFNAKVLLQFPPNMDRSGRTKYPLLVDVNNAPGSSSAIDKWVVDWSTYLSSSKSIIYAKIDGRGTGLRGLNLLHAVYLQLGTVEIQDQINVTKQLQEQYSFIDDKRTGIFGWHYGGYAAAMVLADDKHDVFRCAASLVPVTDWTYFYNLYSERYMNIPVANKLGYAGSRLYTKAAELRDKRFLLVHDNYETVLYQQSVVLAQSLEKYDIVFQQKFYSGDVELYHTLNLFFGECFNTTLVDRK